MRGRGLRHGPPALTADVSVVLARRAFGDWGVRWPDFRLPSDPAAAGAVLRAALERAGSSRVEVCCGGGGRTGTALAWLAVLDGVPAADAVAWVRARYCRRAVETPWQRRFVARLDR